MTIGRPTKLTPETIDKICQAIQMGATYELAAQYGSVTYNTFNEWRKRGAAELERRDGNVKSGTKQWDKEQPFVDFYEAVQKAEASAVIGWLAKIEKAASDGTWQAAAWKLERRYPDTYGRTRVDHDHTTQGDKLNFNTDAAIAALLKARDDVSADE